MNKSLQVTILVFLVFSLDNVVCKMKPRIRLLKEINDSKVNEICDSLKLLIKEANQYVIQNDVAITSLRKFPDRKIDLICNCLHENLNHSNTFSLINHDMFSKIKIKIEHATLIIFMDDNLLVGFFDGILII